MRFAIGQSVNHKSFGKGTIVAQHYNNGNVWNVQFKAGIVAINGKDLSRF